MFSDPYWNPPEEEPKRIKRVLEGIKQNVSKLKNILFVVIKSWNDNVVLYEYEENNKDVVTTSWLSLEEDDAERHKKIGNNSLRSNLNPAEFILFGCSVQVLEGERFLLKINQEELANRTFELVMDSNGNPAVIGKVGDEMCRLEHAYIQMKKGIIPEADYMNFRGKSLTTGKTVTEKIIKR
jgi:hypothetical protein